MMVSRGPTSTSAWCRLTELTSICTGHRARALGEGPVAAWYPRRYSISFQATDGENFQVGGVYREIVPNERLVFSWAWHSTPERESLLTISLKPDGAGTLLTLHHEQFFDAAARDGHEKGWNELLGKLEQFAGQ